LGSVFQVNRGNPDSKASFLQAYFASLSLTVRQVNPGLAAEADAISRPCQF
jgi:hypothetical protein